jgi:hypothetical protein
MDSSKEQLDVDFGNITISGHTTDLSGWSSGVYSLDTSAHMGTVTGGFSYSYPDTVTISDGTWNMAPAMTTNLGGQLSLNGDNADIVINGISLMSKIEAIAERLNLLDVNQELEEEWDQLRELGERYRQLEQELQDKAAMWKTLKTKTPSKPRS